MHTQPFNRTSCLRPACLVPLLWVLAACNSPKALNKQTEGVFTIPETLQVVGVRGLVTGVARNPFSAAIRGANHVTATAVSLFNPGMNKIGGRDAPPPPVAINRPGMDIAKFEAELDRKLNPARSRGTIKLLINGPSFYSTLTQALRTTAEPVDVQVYIFDNDDVALKVADDLKAASKRVPVRVIFDDLGTQQASHVDPPSGVPDGFEPPNDILAYLKQDSKIDARRLNNVFLTSTHTKIITIGRSRAFTGGMNIGREYYHDWHDMMVEVRGPAVGMLQAELDHAMAETRLGGDLVRLFSRGPHPGRNRKYAGIPDIPGSFDIRLIHTRAFRPQIERAVHMAIRRAQRRIWIENPYFADNGIIRALYDARDRGVDVRVILPLRSDEKVMAASNLATADALLQNGIRVYSYPRPLHLKTALFDDWAFLGSANYDHLSLHLNEEVNLAYSHPQAIRELESQLFEKDFRDSKELKPGSVKPTAKHMLAKAAANHL